MNTEKTILKRPVGSRQAHSTWLQTGETEQKLPLVLRMIRAAFSRIGPIFPGMMSIAMEWMWFRPRRFRISPREKGVLARADKSFYQTVYGRKIPVYSWGAGPLVLLAHGWESRAGQFYAMADTLSAAGFQVVGFDAPGHGNAEGSHTDIIEYIDILLHLSQTYGDPRAIIGHSFGTICSLFAVNRGLAADRLVLMSPPGEISFLVGAFTSMLAIPEAVTERFFRRVQRRFRAYSENVWTEMGPEHSSRKINQQALIFHDVHDKIVPVEQGRILAGNLPNARLVETENLGHHRILRDMDTITTIVDFLRKRSTIT